MKEIPQLTIAEHKQLGRIGEATVKFAKIRQRALQKEGPDKVIGEFVIDIAKQEPGFVLINGEPYQIRTRIHIKHFREFAAEEQQDLLRKLQELA